MGGIQNDRCDAAESDPGGAVLPPRARPGPGPVRVASRRALLVLGGLLAGGRRAFAGADEPRQPSEATRARLKLAGEALEAIRANVGRGQFGPGERDPISIWSRRR